MGPAATTETATHHGHRRTSTTLRARGQPGGPHGAASSPMEITLTDDLYDRIRDEITVEDPGEVEVKGFGRRHIYTLEAMTDLARRGHEDR